jgi:hypothetical protein
MIKIWLAILNFFWGVIAIRSAWDAPDHERLVPAATSQEIVVLALFGLLLLVTAVVLLRDAIREAMKP